MKPDPQTNPITPESLERALESAFQPGLLDEALAEPTSESLEQKILALTDPQTLSLLDEALRVEAPDRLNEKVLEKLLAASAPDARRVAESAPPVLARIAPATRPATWRYAAAAAIVLAAGLGLWYGSASVSPTASPTDNLANRDTPAAPQTARLDQLTFEQEPALFTDATGRVETELRALSDTLDADNIDRDTIWSDMDAYEQFLSDIEADLG